MKVTWVSNRESYLAHAFNYMALDHNSALCGVQFRIAPTTMAAKGKISCGLCRDEIKRKKIK